MTRLVNWARMHDRALPMRLQRLLNNLWWAGWGAIGMWIWVNR